MRERGLHNAFDDPQRWHWPSVLLVRLAFAIQIIANVLASTGIWFDAKFADIANRYPSRLSASSYAFSIWGLIYALQLLYLLRPLFGARRRDFLEVLVGLSCVINVTWIVMWTSGEVKVALGTLCGLWLTLSSSWYLLHIHRRSWLLQGDHCFLDYLTVFVPFSVYFGWVTVAVTLNAVIVADTSLTNGVVAAIIACVSGFTIIIISVGADLFYAAAVVWGLVAIAYKANDHDDLSLRNIVALAVVGIAGAALTRVLTATTYWLTEGRRHRNRRNRRNRHRSFWDPSTILASPQDR